jgi:hypothetical protein
MLNSSKRDHYLVENIELKYPLYITAVPIYINEYSCKINVRIFDKTISNLTIILKDTITQTNLPIVVIEGSNYITTDFILHRKEYISTNIPKKIYQTSATYNLSTDCLKTIDTIKDFNPDYEYYFFDDNDIYNFMLTHYGENSNEINALNWLEPGAYRADLFRYCILDKQGGIYADCKQVWRTGFDSILKSGHDYYYVKDLIDHMAYNALMLTVSNSIPLQLAIQRIIHNVKHKLYIGVNHMRHLGITGPSLLGPLLEKNLDNFKYECAHIKHESEDERKIVYNIIVNNRTNEFLCLTSYDTYNNDRHDKHYSVYFKEKKVYQYKIRYSSSNYEPKK